MEQRRFCGIQKGGPPVRLTGITDGSVYSLTIPTSGGFAPNSDILLANDSVNGNWTYIYDAFNRLASANATGQAYTYAYDRFGNRWQQNGPHSSQPGFDSNNRMVPGLGVTYDAAGDTTNDGSTTYTYDGESRIATASNSISGSSSYVYDANGKRVEKTTATGGTVDFLYDAAGHEIAQVNSSGTWTRGEVYAAGRHVATLNNNTTYYNHSDWLGTERARSNSTGTLFETCTSLAFGDWLTCTGGDPSPMHFTGKERDSESGLDNFGARYNSSQYGRFISPDPLMFNELRLVSPQRWNQYSYSINNPITYSDPDGRDAALVTFGGMVGGLGHDGLLSVHSDGTARFAEFGPASHSVSNLGGAVAPGNVNVDDKLPKIQFGSDGKPTADSLNAVKQAIAKNDEGNIDPSTIQITYVKTSEADAIALDNYFAQREAAAQDGKDPYRVYSHNCDNFCQRGLVAGGVIQKSNFSIVPNIFAWQLGLLLNTPKHEDVSHQICAYDKDGGIHCN